MLAEDPQDPVPASPDPTRESSDPPRIALALSGGGHRATAWSIGAAAALVNTGLHRNIVSVSSVSGGSIANGSLAASDTNLDSYQSIDEYADAVGPTLRTVACTGLFPCGEPTRQWTRNTFRLIYAAGAATAGLLAASIAAGRDLPGWLTMTTVVVAAIVAATAACRIEPLCPNPQRRWVRGVAGAVGGASAVTLGAVPTMWLPGWSDLGWVICWGALLGAAALAIGRRLAQRGDQVQRALASGLYATADGTPRMLGTIDSKVNHVICATDLESADHFYLAPDFLNGYRQGITLHGPNHVSLAAAVQASAALPGAFPPSIIKTGPFKSPNHELAEGATQVVLSDGGVYDNMAEQWELDFKRRTDTFPDLKRFQKPARLVVVANASADWEWKPFNTHKLSWLTLEIQGLIRDQGIQYDVSTARRRWSLIQLFRATQAALDSAKTPAAKKKVEGLIGTIAMIDRTPLRLVEPFLGADAIGLRAHQAKDFLKTLRSDDQWNDMQQANSAVPTTLDAIGCDTTLRLIEHAYTQVMVGLYVIHGLGSLKPFPKDPFRKQLSDCTPTKPPHPTPN